MATLNKRSREFVDSPRFEKYIANKFNYFFLSLLIMIAADPYIEDPRFPLLTFAFLAIMLTLLWALKLPRRQLWFCLALAFIASPLGFLSNSTAFDPGPSLYCCSEFISLCAYIVFMLIVIRALLWRIFTEKNVTADTIRGGISIYFLMGIFWMFAYGMVLLFDPSAISFPGCSYQQSDIMYFSFVTMTTLGYGDIAPVSGAARSLVMLEATLGQVFITVFIARLVGLHLRNLRD